MKGIFEEYATRVHEVGEGFVCAMMEQYVVPLIQRVKDRYVVESIDRLDTEKPKSPVAFRLTDVDCLVLFVKADPDDDTDAADRWKSSSEDEWIEDYGDDLYYK